jgi:hypothetical protein
MNEAVIRYGAAREALITNGYEPIPCKGKRPILADWSARVGVPGHDDANVGLLTRAAPALDLDIDDAPTQAAVGAVVRALAPEALRRTGRGHRCLYLFDRAGEPFKKLRREYRRGDERAVIEWLADGQQFIAFGRHPDTGQEYRWDGPSPLERGTFELQPVDRHGALAILDELEAALLPLGWERATGGSAVGAMIRRREPVAVPYEPTTDAERLAVEALRWLDAEDYGSWVTAGMALKSEDLPYELWETWSRTAPNYDADACAGRWDTFRPRAVGLHQLRRAAGLGTAELDFTPIRNWQPPQPGKEAGPAQAGPKGRGIRTVASLADEAPPPWLVKGLIPQRSLVGLIAAPNVGKSFLLLDLCRAIEQAGSDAGTQWFGRRVKAAPDAIAVIFSYEGSTTLRARALRRRFPGAGTRIVVEHGWPNLRDPASVDRLSLRLREIEEALGGRVALVAFDTLNLALAGGNENAPEDMGAAVASLKRLRDRHGCAVVAVHHLGKDSSRGARGHSSLLGALDTEITVIGDPQGAVRTRTIEVTKVRDGDRTGPIGWFALRVIELGFDEDGDAETSCVVEPTVEEAEGPDPVRSAVAEALAAAPGGLGLNQIARAVGGKKAALMAVLADMVARGDLVERSGKRGARVFLLPGIEASGGEDP